MANIEVRLLAEKDNTSLLNKVETYLIVVNDLIHNLQVSINTTIFTLIIQILVSGNENVV
jgi:hypothetical protein